MNVQLERELQTLTRDITAELGGQWTAVPIPEDRQWYAMIRHQDGRELGLRLEDGRITIHGYYPRVGSQGGSPRAWGVVPHDAQSPEIGVTAARGAKKIAQAIATRLLPTYTDLYHKCVEAKTRHLDYLSRVASLADQLATAGADVLERATHHPGADREPRFYLRDAIESSYATIDVQGDDTVKLDLRVTGDMALVVVRALNKVLMEIKGKQ